MRVVLLDLYRKYYPKSLAAVKVKDVDRGYYDYMSSGPLLACVWRDKRIINFLTTIQCSSGNASVRRLAIVDDSVVYQMVTCPPCLPDYQTYMRGVDRGDQLMGYYRIGRSRKWWKRGYWYILDVVALKKQLHSV